MVKISDINGKSKEFMEAIYAFSESRKGFLLIAGSNGTGKTFASRAIYDSRWHPNSDDKFINQADLKIKWQAAVMKEGAVEYLLSQILDAPLLVLDDIGISRPTEAFLEFLYLIADKRFESSIKRGTIITTNLNTESMRNMFGDPFLSRVSSGICVRCDGEDRRNSKF